MTNTPLFCGIIIFSRHFNHVYYKYVTCILQNVYMYVASMLHPPFFDLKKIRPHFFFVNRKKFDNLLYYKSFPHLHILTLALCIIHVYNMYM